MSTHPPHRVFQVATGNVGSEMITRFRDHPDLELVGLYCYSPEKVGRDAGEIVGIDPLGVVATDKVEDIVSTAPDCVNFNGVWPDMELFETVLEAGINVVSTADWITGHHRDRNFPLPSGRRPTEVIEAACRKGGATFYGTGMNPGLANILSVVSTAGMGRVDHLTVLESVDVHATTPSTPGRTAATGCRSTIPAYRGCWRRGAPSSSTLFT
jgi:4-hydroxy-tetrahydrodipicolinate reductase